MISPQNATILVVSKMKVILSRKGFDTKNGCCPSPIMPDGTLLSLPIPSNDELTYADIAYQGLPIDQLLKHLNPKQNYQGCHLDPDIRMDIWLNVPAHWQPAFGQIDSSQGLLRNQNVNTGDLFLFFGMFRLVQQKTNNSYKYVRKSPILHVIFGYLQVDRVLTQPEDVAKYYWHPHASKNRLIKTNNALYLARKTLNFDETMLGSGVLKYAKNRVLTQTNSPMAIWREIPALMPTNIVSERKNCASGQGIYYQGIWQELILKENEESENWAKNILSLSPDANHEYNISTMKRADT